MLDTDTKRRIDTARDILVGKVPDPKSQVEQITIALIYKFMDDMDAESEEFGGKRKFFAGEFARYGWAKLMRSGLGGHETLEPLRRSDRQDAGEPRHPAALPRHLQERLSALPRPGDPARLPQDHRRVHLRPQRTARRRLRVPALRARLAGRRRAVPHPAPHHRLHRRDHRPEEERDRARPGLRHRRVPDLLLQAHPQANTDAKGTTARFTPDDKGRLAQNFKGYDISPDMVRLSLVNMYLHGFADPHIFEYDTLTSQDRWNEYADVILANPPFMSPKGGIKPHNRFSVQSKRSEVLFVDYMAEHLTPHGRAGIIVPEGIIFQSQTAYTQLRKMLVEEYLVAVVSLPAGVFNPYSGVKTSILILDKSLAKADATPSPSSRSRTTASASALSAAPSTRTTCRRSKAELDEYLQPLCAPATHRATSSPRFGLIVPKEKIAANGDYNLSGERYREGVVVHQTIRLCRWRDL